MNDRRKKVLVVDVGGNHVKVLVTGEKIPRQFASGPSMTAEEMVAGVLKIAEGWEYESVSIGYPGPVLRGRPVSEPHNLGPGWVGFDFEAAFGRPVKLINDAAMQALGSYDGGRMLFLGLGTGLGSTMIVDGIVEPMELGHLPYRKRDLRGLHRNPRIETGGQKKVATLCRGRCGSPDRRTRTGLCRRRRRQRPQAKGAASELPGGRKRECVSRRVSLVGADRRTERFCSPKPQQQ
jgi:predicted NBD/HSP70 family sugar kinase